MLVSDPLAPLPCLLCPAVVFTELLAGVGRISLPGMGEVFLARIKNVLVFPTQTMATVTLKMDTNFETSQELCLSA